MAPLVAGYLLMVALAVMVGFWVSAGSLRMLFLLAAAAVVGLVVVGMQKRVWMLIVFGWLFTGQILLLPLPFAVRDLMVMLAFCGYAIHRAVSHRGVRAGWNVIDVVLAVHLVYLYFGLLLHPVGFHVLGAGTVGARPYLNVTLAVMGYWVVVHLPDSVKAVSRIPLYMLAAATVLGAMQGLMRIFPSVIPYFYALYSELDVSAYFTSVLGTAAPEYSRFIGVSTFGQYMILVLCSYYPPETLFNPLRGRFYAAVIGGASILSSGFRTNLAWAMASVGIGSWLRRSWRELAVSAVAGAMLLGALSFGQGRLYELPLSMQRAMCWLPGQWNPDVIADAEGSSQFRFQLWRNIIAWRLINDWWFGDGFGANVGEIVKLSRSTSDVEEHTLAAGNYHSGPLTTIHWVGIIGLILLYILSITAAICGYKTVQRCRGTPLHAVAVFLAIQFIWGPITYALVFGSYDVFLPDLIFQLGLLRLLMRFCDQGFVVPSTATSAPRAAVPVMAGAQA